MNMKQVLLFLFVVSVTAQQADLEEVGKDSKKVSATFLDHYSAAPGMPKNLRDATSASSDSTLHQLKNEYLPGKNGPVFETPAPGDDMGQSYVDTGRGAVILAFFFFGIVFLICWIDCKAWCKTLTVFG
mmetsp:Transcript_27125/g.42139  ORF Transcript_27125/g.42139 Transcript_27125/m.42139 type:complete len:129 (+) Transcript_27125:58-444(+)